MSFANRDIIRQNIATAINRPYSMSLLSIVYWVTRPVLESLVVSGLRRWDCHWLAQNLPQSTAAWAACLIPSAMKYDHITVLLRDLLWLRVPKKYDYHLAVLALGGGRLLAFQKKLLVLRNE